MKPHTHTHTRIIQPERRRRPPALGHTQEAESMCDRGALRKGVRERGERERESKSERRKRERRERGRWESEEKREMEWEKKRERGREKQPYLRCSKRVQIRAEVGRAPI